MNVVVDTNVVFSAILNPNGKISDLLFNPSLEFTFFAPSFILDELKKHNQKLCLISELTEGDLGFLKRSILSKIKMIDLEGIGPNSWEKAISLVKGIDEFDAPFVALAIEMDCILWTGDKKLKKGLEKLGITWVVDTNQLLDMKS
ncbi:PIN domain-containing protein [Algoriphagus sp.]|uniref:PIN domain-containing protein n=1 Tax=Algoriphagus sp. TaxID=1872435 RepID=UPI0039188C6D